MISEKFIPFAKPDITEEEISAVVSTLRSDWITTGKITQEFERSFADYIGGNNEAIAVNSATSGLHLALEACGIKNGDEVIVPTLTFTATAEVVRYLGAHPVFVDCDLSSFNIKVDDLESKITNKTKAIIPVHMAGLLSNMHEILRIAKKYDLKVIEDAAHSLPAKINNISVGNFDSDATIFSFYANKSITTGEGGMIVTRNPEIAKRCRIMRLHGIDRDAFDRYTSNKPEWHYNVVAPGFKYNLTDIASSMGIVQLKRLNGFYKKRLQLAQIYQQQLRELPIILPPDVKNNETDIHSWHLFIIRLKAECKVSRDLFIQKMSDLGIGTSVHFIPLHKQPYWKNQYKLQEVDFVNANYYFEYAVSIPLYTVMSFDDQQRVIKAIRNILE